MRPRFQRILFVVALIIFAIFTAPTPPTQADNSPITLSVSVPPNVTPLLQPAIESFEKDHPDIKVRVTVRDTQGELAINDLDKHMQGAETLVQSSDIVFVDSYILSPESVAAGYFLNLKPLMDTDTTLNAGDYIPIAWQSSQISNGFWAFPATVSANLMVYDHAAFDAAGLAYPSEQWTIDDLDKAVRQLTQRDSSGKVILAGMAFTSPLNRANLIISLSGTESVEGLPHFTANQSLDHILTLLAKLEAEGLISSKPENAAMNTCCVYLLLGENNPDNRWAASLLPGGHSAATVQGFAVSAGTRYPEQAYALALALSQTDQLSSYFIDTIPAYQHAATSQPATNSMFPSQTYELLTQAIDQAIAQPEFQSFSYIVVALNKIEQGSSIPDALQAAEQTAADALKQAASRKSKTAITVATPIPDTPLAVNESSLKFGLVFNTNYRALPNKALWDRLIQTFTESDPQVKAINLDMTFNPSKNGDDCYYAHGSSVRIPALDEIFYSLDPFMATDPNFNNADILPSALSMVSTDNKIWAYPLTIEPMVLSYDPDALEKAGIPRPQSAWTIDQFVDALKHLRPDPKAPPVLAAPVDLGNGTHLLLLIAAYGGLPLDFSTEPPAINFTDPATVDAIRQVLDLVKQGYIQTGTLGNIQHMRPTESIDAPLRVQMLNTLSAGLASPDTPANKHTDSIMLFPSGTTYQAIAYDVGAAHIAKTASNPDACYRWISTIAQHPELFNAMPATYSAIESPALEAAQGKNTVMVYKQIAQLLKTPQSAKFPAASRSFPAFITSLFLYRAFDDYVLDDKDLQAALQDAELKARTFQECVKSMKPYYVNDPDGEKVFLRDIDRCVTNADPSLKGFFAPR